MEPVTEHTGEAPRRARRSAFEFLALAVLAVAFAVLAGRQFLARAPAAELPLVAWSPVPVMISFQGTSTTFAKGAPDVRTAPDGPAGPFRNWAAVWTPNYRPGIDIRTPLGLGDKVRSWFGKSAITRIVAAYGDSGERTVVGSVEWAKYVQER